MLINPLALGAVDCVAFMDAAYRNYKALRWNRGKSRMMMGVSSGSLFVHIRRADGVGVQWLFTNSESIKRIRDLCNQILEARGYAEK